MWNQDFSCESEVWAVAKPILLSGVLLISYLKKYGKLEYLIRGRFESYFINKIIKQEWYGHHMYTIVFISVFRSYNIVKLFSLDDPKFSQNS